jgi:poly(U)-specific endoribonuclease
VRIRGIIAEGFKTMGWDTSKKSRATAVNPALFSTAKFAEALEAIREDLSNWSPPVNPTPEELASLSAACNRLWELDIHRLVPDRDYSINVQGGKFVSDNYDAAAEPLFRFIDEAALSQPTFRAFISLLDNYVASTGTAEVVSAEELSENRRFLGLIMDTKPMQYVHQYLIAKQLTKATTREAFIQVLNELWFGLYRRKVTNDSSAFEHVFLGEIVQDKNEVTGFHNWIQLYLEERKGDFDYRGYIKPRRRGHSSSAPHSQEQLITLSFAWRGYLKKVSSSFVGTSPEFEVALYTLCRFCGQQENVVQCGPYKVLVTIHTFPDNPRPDQKVFLGSSFPGEAPLEEDEAARRIQNSFTQKKALSKKK